MDKNIHYELEYALSEYFCLYEDAILINLPFYNNLIGDLNTGNYPYKKYISRDLEVYLAQNCPCGDKNEMTKFNELVLFLWNKSETLKKVVWNSFRDYFHLSDIYKPEFALKNLYEKKKKTMPKIRGNSSNSFETERLIIKPFNTSNIEESAKLVKYIREQDKANEDFCYSLENIEMCIVISFGIYEKKSNDLIGTIGLYSGQRFYQQYIRDFDNVERQLQYYIKQNYRGKGFAKEALLALIEQIKKRRLSSNGEFKYCDIVSTQKPKIKLLKIGCSFDNIGSQKLALTCGFVDCGIHTFVRNDWPNKKQQVQQEREFVLIL